VIAPVDAEVVVTPWEVVTGGGMPAARALFDRQLAGRPFTDRLVLGAGGTPTGERVAERAWRARHGAGRVVEAVPAGAGPG
jgi:hypothetical protein